MARSNKLAAILALMIPLATMAQSSPVPSDIPYAVNVGSAQIVATDGFMWSADGGVYLNDPARKQVKDTIVSLQDQNSQLRKMYDDQSKELVKAEETSGGLPVWAQVTLSLIGTGASVAAIAFAATHK